MPRRAARAAITCASPTITTRPGNRSRASNAQRSGPMPAGSPAVSATSGSELVGTALEHLHEVPAEGRLHGLAHFAVLQLVHRALELGHGVARRHPPEVA